MRISPEGLRFSTEEGSVMEAFIFLERSLFTTYTYNAPNPPSSQDDAPTPPVFEISLISLLETLNIFGLSDPTNAPKQRPGEYDAFAAHRLNRHAGINAFSNHALGVSGICRFTYAGEGSPLSIHMAESGVTTTCDLTTYEAASTDEIPFDRDDLALKTILRSSYLLDAINELSAMNPAHLTVLASPNTGSRANLSLSASGALGSATVDFATTPTSAFETSPPVLETFHCPAQTRASFNFSLLKSAQRAMAAGTKVSLRLDAAGVLSLQFLVEVEPSSSSTGGSGGGGAEAVAFVDFRIVPLIEGEDDGDSEEAGGESTDDD